MGIPNYQECMLPLLEAISDGRDHRMRDISCRIADRFRLTEEERAELLPSGQQTVISNRVAWAKTYLKMAGLVTNPTRGSVRITAEGQRVLAEKPERVDMVLLRRYESFRGFRERKSTDPEPTNGIDSVVTPEEAIYQAHQSLRANLASDLLDKVKECSPQFFERLVVELLVKMGYGGSLADAGQVVGRSGDGGIDGIINEDRLGLDIVCIQAKRWENPVGRPNVQAFAGSMEGHRAKKGVLITTSNFTKDAEQYVTHIERKIVLIDGRRLADLMIEHDVGVAIARSVHIKRIDQDYFEADGV